MRGILWLAEKLKKYMLLEIIYFLDLIYSYIENSTQNLISVRSQRFASAASKREHTSNTVFCIRRKRIWSCMRYGIVL
jgi:hypothetical protein